MGCTYCLYTHVSVCIRMKLARETWQEPRTSSNISVFVCVFERLYTYIILYIMCVYRTTHVAKKIGINLFNGGGRNRKIQEND